MENEMDVWQAIGQQIGQQYDEKTIIVAIVCIILGYLIGKV
jgi:hypothetical protein